MAGLVTTETDRSVLKFIQQVNSKSKQEDSYVILNLITEITGLTPKVWGNEKQPDFIIGFGKYSYTRKGSKEELEWFKIGFAPRKNKLTLYLTSDISKHEDLISRLGKCKYGKGCLYINSLSDVDIEVLKSLILRTYTHN